MKKLFIVLFLLIPLILSAQQIFPPAKGWSRIYVDTLNMGLHGTWSYNNGVTDSMKSADTTNIIHMTDIWGMGTLFIKTTAVGTFDVTDSVSINFLGYIPNLGEFSTITNNTTAVLVDSINGNYIGYNQFKKLPSLSYWTVFDDYVYVIGSGDTVIVELWQLIK